MSVSHGPGSVSFPEWPALASGTGTAAVLTADGELVQRDSRETARLLDQSEPPLLIHAPSTWRRLGLKPMPAYDLLELFAFVRPAKPAVPTARGLAQTLDLPAVRQGLENAASALPNLAFALLQELTRDAGLPANRDLPALAKRMGDAGWLWAPLVMAALDRGGAIPPAAKDGNAFRVWRRLPEWEEGAPPPEPSTLPVSPVEARTRLARLVGEGAETRQGQADYASAAAAAFTPRETAGAPNIVLAEAGTGTGKTLGYVAPASLWAERNHAPVWISTYTRHLQRQVESELERLFPDPKERHRRVVLRKGRENYLCLLNMEDAVTSMLVGSNPALTIPLGLIARWASVTSDGDILGGDLPGWFIEIFGAPLLGSLADRRGECLYAACNHWKRCFVEHGIRRAREADLVVANHALVLTQAAWGGLDDNYVPTRYVFDEGHHIFDAADAAFSAELSGREAAELRRWLLGAEGMRSRGKGLTSRIGDLVGERADLMAPLDAALMAARSLPAPGWGSRLTDDPAPPPVSETAIAEPLAQNPSEVFLVALRAQVLARLSGRGGEDEARAGFAAECDLLPTSDDVVSAADTLKRALMRIAEPLTNLRARLLARLDEEADELDQATRARIEGMGRTIARRALEPLKAWIAMLAELIEPQPVSDTFRGHVQFLRLDRSEGHVRDVALLRHWLDPTLPFATTLAAPAHGLLITSATLRDGGEDDPEQAWSEAEARVGANHLALPAIRASLPSPFDYAERTRAFVINDVDTGDPASLAAAYRTLFLSSGGGGLGLFTAIGRLRSVHRRIAPALEQAGLPLYAQHIDAMNNATLVDIFRAEENSCLLGTDAMRDGVDVPGNALRLVVFERVPWPRPDILHRERRIHLSGGAPKEFDDRIARLRLRQAFGRLIRRVDDRGVFVLLDRRTPTRLLSAFPPGVAVERVGLAEAAATTRAFLGPQGNE
ncbi:ATP-dependent DNA helicase [Acidisoma silvae]|uniref:ATP-dependent DNA helicase n=1 Tax=Acidisoma silvae TaxID=2802396 RepID=A0A963YNJ7_9PROT|nr:ATP-dependent DNA helicase [Acidisoma silvae]MCB8874183.1 ATP-dependent DNA helicase [Acidisoma silvae]